MATQLHKTYFLGECELEPGAYLLTRNNAPIPLSRKRFQVLLYLVEERHRLVTRQELLERFWDGHDVYEENLTKCISDIRKALGDQKKPHRFVETLTGLGYRYIGPVEERTATDGPSSFEVETTEGVRIVFEEDDAIAQAPKIPAALSIQSAAERPHTAGRNRKIAVFLTLVLALAGAAAVVMSFRHRANSNRVPAAPIHSVGILPLKNLTNDPASDYFSDGVTESLITSLSKIEGLKVISRGSVFSFKDKDIDPLEVGKNLGVGALLQGSLRKEGDLLRVTVRLVSADDGSVMWASETYDRPLRDVFSLQDEIARHVAAALRVHLTGEGERQLARRYTENVTAYELYLKGRYSWNKRTTEGLNKGAEYFQQAINADPNYALAYAGLADSYILLGLYGALPPGEGLLKAKAAAVKALEIDDRLAEAHTSLAGLRFFYEWNWLAAENEFKRALELSPNQPTAHQWYCEYLELMGRHDEALAEIKQARETDPLSLIVNTTEGWLFYSARQYDLAISAYDKTLEIEPSFASAHFRLGEAYEQKGMYEQAISEFKRALAFSTNSKIRMAALGHAYAVAGKKGEAGTILKELKEPSRDEYLSPYYLAIVYAGLNDKEQAFQLLEKAHEDRSTVMVFLKLDPRFDSLRSDARFNNLLSRMALKPS